MPFSQNTHRSKHARRAHLGIMHQVELLGRPERGLGLLVHVPDLPSPPISPLSVSNGSGVRANACRSPATPGSANALARTSGCWIGNRTKRCSFSRKRGSSLSEPAISASCGQPEDEGCQCTVVSDSNRRANTHTPCTRSGRRRTPRRAQPQSPSSSRTHPLQ